MHIAPCQANTALNQRMNEKELNQSMDEKEVNRSMNEKELRMKVVKGS